MYKQVRSLTEKVQGQDKDTLARHKTSLLQDRNDLLFSSNPRAAMTVRSVGPALAVTFDLPGLLQLSLLILLEKPLKTSTERSTKTESRGDGGGGGSFRLNT